MFCKNCGKEMKDGDAFCRECGTKNEQGATEVNAQIDTTAFQSAMPNSSGTAVAVKKKSKGKFIIIGVFVFLFIIVIACAVSGSDSSEKHSSKKSNADIEELFYSTSEGLNVATYVYNAKFSYKETDKKDVYDILVKGKVQLGYIGSGVYENITINFTYDSDSGDCDYAGSSPVDWQYLLQQYQYNSAY